MSVLTFIGEQLLHMFWSFGLVGGLYGIRTALGRQPRWTWRAVVAGAVAGLLLSLPREVVDQWPIERWWDTLIDLTFFIAGGALGGVMGWRISEEAKKGD